MSRSAKTAAEKNEEYLHRLEQKNRLKKALSVKSSTERMTEDRERGFSTHFAGANATENKRKVRLKASVTKTPSLPAMTQSNVTGHDLDGKEQKKKGWNQTPHRAVGRQHGPSISPVLFNDNGKNSAESRAKCILYCRQEGKPGLNLFSSPGQDIDVEDDNADDYYDDEDFETENVDEESLDECDFAEPNFSKTRAIDMAFEDEGEVMDDSVDYDLKSETGRYDSYNAKDIVQMSSSNVVLPTREEKSTQPFETSWLVARVQALRPVQQERIFSMIDEMEAANDAESILQTESKPLYLDKGTQQRDSMEKAENDKVAIAENDIPNTISANNIKLRLKAYNAWKKTRYASLSAIRLCIRNTNNEVSLSDFSLRVLADNKYLPGNSDVVRSASYLLQKNRVLQRQDWVFPLLNDGYVELELIGRTEDPILDDIELLVWNGREDSLNKYSPVMDMDIYINNKCHWTGTLKKAEECSVPRNVTDTTDIRLLVDDLGNQRFPSVTVALGKPDLSDSRKTTISRQATSFQSRMRLKKYSDAPSHAEIGGLSHLDFMPSSSEVGALNSRSKLLDQEQKEEPEWFSDLKTPRMEDSSNCVSDTLSETKPKKSRRSSRDFEESDTTADKGAADIGNSKSRDLVNHMVMSAAPLRNGRRRLHNEEEEKKEEASLRQSLDALKKSERKNRGRIEHEVANAFSINSTEQALPQLPDSIVEDGAKENDISKGGDFYEMHHKKVSDGVLSGEIEKQKKIKERSHRIGQIQETVSNTLQGLASVMSSNIPAERVLNTESSSNKFEAKGKEIAKGDDIFCSSQAVDMNCIPPEVCVEESYMESSVYEIPVLPRGKSLTIEILSTWGDPYYVGLNGLDVFDEKGNQLGLQRGINKITAIPNDINDLPEYDNDPRTVANLLDENNFTRDDLHVWLAPHGGTMSPPLQVAATILIEFSSVISLSLVRIWNYNKSRTHCYRGAKRIRLKMDEVIVFEGDIKISPGLLNSVEECSELILFSTDKIILEAISSYDSNRGYQNNADESTSLLMDSLKERHTEYRPTTSDGSTLSNKALNSDRKVIKRKKTLKLNADIPAYAEDEGNLSRPHTSAQKHDVSHSEVNTKLQSKIGSNDLISPHSSIEQLQDGKEPLELQVVEIESRPRLKTDHKRSAESRPAVAESDLVRCRVLSFTLDSTWGDKNYIGLCGLEILLGCSSFVADLSADALEATPHDLSAIGVFDDPRILGNIANGINNTTDDRCMWLIPFTQGGTHELRVDLGSKCGVAGFNVWNYNKSSEDILRGVRMVSVSADEKLIGIQEFRIGPGCDGVDYKQQVYLRDVRANRKSPSVPKVRYLSHSLRQDYEPPFKLSGMLWKINIYSNWGDEYYVGLDELEFLDAKGDRVDISKTARIVSSPHMADLEIGANDPRIPQNLALGDRSLSWLSPLSQSMTRVERESGVRNAFSESATKPHKHYFYDHNTVFVLFDQPVHVSAIRFYNYSKTPTRGVKSFGVEVDNSIVFMGKLEKFGSHLDRGQSIVFSNDPTLSRLEKDKVVFVLFSTSATNVDAKVFYCGSSDQDVLCINDRKVIVRSKGMYEDPSVSSEGICADISKRPTTAMAL